MNRPTPPKLPHSAPAAPRPRARRGMVLLFVVVLLTLLAILGSAYLVTSRIGNAQVSPEARGGEADPFGIEAASRIEQIMTETQTAVQRRLVLDTFAWNGIVPPDAGAHPSAARILGDDSGDAGGLNNRKPATDPVDPNGTIGDGTDDLMWRPMEADRQNVMPLPGAPPAEDQLGVYGEMAGFGGYAAERAFYAASTLIPPVPGKTVHFPYFHVDALGGTDPHLASRLPVFDNFSGITPTTEFIWPWVSAPLVGLPGFPVDNAVANPFTGIVYGLDAPAAPEFDPARLRMQVIPTTYGPIAYPPPPEVQSLTSDDEFYNDRLRVWPGLAIDVDGDRVYGTVGGEDLVLPAADADGDGVADSLLVPIVFDESVPPLFAAPPPAGSLSSVANFARYTDPQTGYVYLIAIRIVDNNAAVNVNTALTSAGDLRLPLDDLANNSFPLNLAMDGPNGNGNPDVLFDPTLTTSETFDATFDAPNRGIYLSNIGLIELFFQGIDNGTAPGAAGDRFDDSGGGSTRQAQFQTLFANLMSGDPVVDNRQATLRDDAQHATLGELLAMNRDRLLDFEVGTLTPPNTANGSALIVPFRSADEDAALLFNGGGWNIPESTPTRLENVAFDSLRVSAGNFVPNPELQFRHFPIGNDVGLGEAAGEGGGDLRFLWATLFKMADPDFTHFTAATGGTTYRGMTSSFPISPRAGIVAHNGVNQAFRPHVLTTTVDYATANILPPGMPPYAGAGLDVRPPVRASANTAGFAELWRAYWNVMVEPDYSPAAGYAGPVPSYVPGQRLPDTDRRNTTQRMFSSDLFLNRSSQPGVGAPLPTEYQVLTLRAALAAVNALDIRDVEDGETGAGPDRVTGTADDVPTGPGPDARWGTADDLAEPGASRAIPTAADIVLNVEPSTWATPPAPAPQTLFARPIGSEAQPFITEVMMTFLPGGGLQYIGIELYNPYPFPLTLADWHLVAILRGGTGGIPLGSITSLTGAFGTATGPITDPAAPGEPITIPPNNFVVLQNTPPPSTVVHDPDAVTEGRVYTNLALAASIQTSAAGPVDHEIMLMRPLSPPVGVPPPAPPLGLGAASSEADLRERFAPVDLIDPSGMWPFTVTPLPGISPFQWRYVRPSGMPDPVTPGETIPDPRSWKFVSHGAYTSSGAPNSMGFVPVALTTSGRLGAADLESEVDPAFDGDPTDGAPVIRSIPWGPVLAGPITVDNGSITNPQQLPMYPYSGFARDGDALGIPFIGGYLIYRDSNGDGVLDPAVDELADLVPPTLDAYFAESDDTAVAPLETHVGRFLPQGPLFVPFVVGATPDEGYDWASDLFEYITTLHAPGKDLFPHGDNRYVDNSPSEDLNGNGVLDAGEDLNGNTQLDGLDNRLVVNPQMVPLQDADPATYPLTGSPLFVEKPAPVANLGAAIANGYAEAFLPVEGLINLNTADYGILKLLPLAVTDTGTVDPTRISGQSPAFPAGNPAATPPTQPGLAGLIYLSRDPAFGTPAQQPYGSLFRLNALGSGAALAENFRSINDVDPLTPPVDRRAAGDLTGMRLVNLNPLTSAGPTFDDLSIDEDTNGNGVQDAGETDANGNGAFDSWYYDQALEPAIVAPNYEDDFLQLTRISNLATTRSDSYTVYIVVQAWENFGNDASSGSPARMIRQQRSAFTVDRSGILPFNPNSAPVPNQPWTAADMNGDAWQQALKVTPIPVD